MTEISSSKVYPIESNTNKTRESLKWTILFNIYLFITYIPAKICQLSDILETRRRGQDLQHETSHTT